MSEVKRYRQPADTPRTMLEFPDGDFVAYSDYAAIKANADGLAEALKDAKKTVEKRFLECGRQGANAHMTNPLRTEWEHCRATLHEIDAALATYQESHPLYASTRAAEGEPMSYSVVVPLDGGGTVRLCYSKKPTEAEIEADRTEMNEVRKKMFKKMAKVNDAHVPSLNIQPPKGNP